ncbi:hypothetical protein [Sphingomonas sp. HMP9]|uniref:hypothetical protein n=1 Tax=Sphingomonas sp. HMP9 TaxID=1517554 RepID=UPI001597146C|nr:hypothetical protein [Sphingomonas sp. HMP9]
MSTQVDRIFRGRLMMIAVVMVQYQGMVGVVNMGLGIVPRRQAGHHQQRQHGQQRRDPTPRFSSIGPQRMMGGSSHECRSISRNPVRQERASVHRRGQR